MALPSKPLSRQTRIYLALWRKAYQTRNDGGEPLTLKASSLTMALDIRTGMYRAIRPYRTGEEADEELRQASELFVISAPKSPPFQIVIKPRASLTELEAELEALGIRDDDLLLPEEKRLGEELEALVPKAKGGNDRETPFYTRER